MLLQVKGKFRIRISFKVSKKINFPNFAKEELIDIANSNEILKFIPGFLVNAIEQGKTVVLDCINEANSTVRESLNGLLDKKNNGEENYFDLPENTENQKIKIHPNFRMICTCNINNIKDMSPAFVNRFDIIVLENKLQKLNDEQYNELLCNMFISFDRIPHKKNRINANQRNIDLDIQFSDDKNEDGVQNEENEIEANETIENKEEIIKREKEVLNGEKELIKKIYDKIKILPLNKEITKKAKDYSHLRTITSLNRLFMEL